MGSYGEPRSCPRCSYQTKDSGNLRRHVQNCNKQMDDMSNAFLFVKGSQEGDTTVVPPLKFEDEKPLFEGAADLANTDSAPVPKEQQVDRIAANHQPTNKFKPASKLQRTSGRSFTRNIHFTTPSAPGIQYPRAAEYGQPYAPVGSHHPNASNFTINSAKPKDYYGYPSSAAYDTSQASDPAVMMQILHSLLKIEHRLDRIETHLGLM